MADPNHYQFLLACLDKPNGRRHWLEFKMRRRWVDLSTADLAGRDLRNYDFADANLSTAVLSGALLEGADLSDANLALADLHGARLGGACLDRANLAGANLERADLADARLEAGLLRGARLGQARLTGADLNNADLSEVDLRGADCRYARLNSARLDRARVAEANLTGCLLDSGVENIVLDHEAVQQTARQFKPLRSRAGLTPGADRPRRGGLGAAAVVEMPPPQAHQAPADEDEESRHIREHKQSRARARAAAAASQADTTASGAGNTGAATTGGPTVERRTSTTADFTEPGAPPFPARSIDVTTIEGCSALLEIAPNAPAEEVVKAFRRKAKLFHPDMVRHLNPRLQELAAEEFQRLHQAYEMLTRRTTRPLTGIRWAEGVPRRASAYEQTREDYEKLARVNPTHTGILYNLGWKYFEEGCYVEARELFERVLALDANDEDALFNLMIVRLYLEVQLPLLEQS